MRATPSSTPVSRTIATVSASMRRWSAGAASTVAPPGIGLDEGHLPDVVQQGGVLEVEQLPLRQRQLAADPQGEGGDPLGVPGGRVAGGVGETRERADALQVGRADAHVATEGEEGEHEGHEEERQRGDAERRGREGDEHAGHRRGPWTSATDDGSSSTTKGCHQAEPSSERRPR